jgi:prepilin-type N-terminal cleavage/methylation domain-containing protein
MRRDREAGLTMVEIMVSLVLVSIAAVSSSPSSRAPRRLLRDQSAIAEVQQTLRVATEQILRDLRWRLPAKSINLPVAGSGNPTKVQGKCVPDGTAIVLSGPVSIDNNTNAPDILRLQYGDTAISARIESKGPSFHASTTQVTTSTGFETGDIADRGAHGASRSSATAAPSR